MSVQTILNLGDDQTVNQYQILFPAGIPGVGDATNICLRMDTTFTAPAQTMNKYDIWHKGIKVPKTGTVTETDKAFPIEVRLDQNGAVYKAFDKWKNNCYDFTNRTALLESQTRTTMLVQLTDTQENVMMTWTFTGVKIFELTPPSLDNATGDPARVTIGFIYADFSVA
jgi:hypothetical protein